MFGFLRRRPVTHSAPEDAHKAQRRGALLIDVREAHEWRSGHARGARHIPLSRLLRDRPKLPADADIHVICASGHRSRTAARVLSGAGFASVSSVRGGMSAWRRAGLPIDR